MIENSRRTILRERMEKCHKKSADFLDGKNFYKDFCTTVYLLSGRETDVGLSCPFGDISRLSTRVSAGVCCMCSPVANYVTGRGNPEGCCFASAVISLTFLSMPVYLVLLFLCLLFELSKVIFWVLTCFHFCKSRNCVIRNRKGKVVQVDKGKVERPYPTREELWKKSQAYSHYMGVVEEEVSLPVACAICCFGGQPCDCCA